MAFSLTNDNKQSLITITQIPHQDFDKLCMSLSDYLHGEQNGKVYFYAYFKAKIKQLLTFCRKL